MADINTPEFNEGKSKGESFLLSRKFTANQDKNQAAMNKSFGSFSTSIVKSINSLNESIKNLNKNILNFGSYKKEKDSTIRKEDSNIKIYKAVDGLEDLMKENNKLQRKQLEGKGKGLLGLLGGLASFAALAIAGGGLLGFLLTGKEEFLFSVIRGFKKFFFDIPSMMSRTVKSMAKLIPKSGKIIKGATRVAKAFKGGGIKGAVKSIKRISGVGKAIGKAGTKTVTKAGFKKIPVIGSLLALFFAIERFKKGDWVGGLLEIGSGLAGFLHLIPGVGSVAAVGIQLLIDGIILARDAAKSFGGEKTKEPQQPKKGSTENVKKLPIIGSLVGLFDAFKSFAADPVKGIKLGLISIQQLLPIPGFSFVLEHVVFPMIDGVSWIAKETPKFLGMVGEKAKEMAPAVYDTIKKLPVIGWFIRGIEGLIDFAKDPKKGVENIANFMDKMIPGSGDIVIKAGGAIFGAAEWIKDKSGVVASWGASAVDWIKNTAIGVVDSTKKAFESEKSAGLGLKEKVQSDAYSIDGEMPSSIKSTVRVLQEASKKIKKETISIVESGLKFIQNGTGLKLASKSVDISGMSPYVWNPFQLMALEYKSLTGKDIQINSAYRSMEKQKKLRDEAIKKYGLPEANKWVAAPGKSMHNYGFALDIDPTDGNFLESSGLLNKYGFDRPMAHEPWHIEPKGLKERYADIRTGSFIADTDLSKTQVGDAYSIGQNIPSKSIPNVVQSSVNNKIDLSDETILALAKAMGASFKGAIPKPVQGSVVLDTNMRG